MKKKSRLKPTRRHTARSLARTRQRQGEKLTPSEALKIGRLPMAERAKARRRVQNRKAAQRHRERVKQQAKLKLRLEAPTWRLPPESEQRPYAPTVAAAEEQPKPSPRPEPPPPPPRRAVRAEPTRGTHGPNRGGESARSWQPARERNPTKVPVDVADFVREEF